MVGEGRVPLGALGGLVLLAAVACGGTAGDTAWKAVNPSPAARWASAARVTLSTPPLTATVSRP